MDHITRSRIMRMLQRCSGTLFDKKNAINLDMHALLAGIFFFKGNRQWEVGSKEELSAFVDCCSYVLVKG